MTTFCIDFYASYLSTGGHAAHAVVARPFFTVFVLPGILRPAQHPVSDLSGGPGGLEGSSGVSIKKQG